MNVDRLPALWVAVMVGPLAIQIRGFAAQVSNCGLQTCAELLESAIQDAPNKGGFVE